MTLSQHFARAVSLSRPLQAVSQGCSFQDEGCIVQRCYYKSGSSLESRELAFHVTVTGTRVGQGGCNLTLHPPGPNGSHADWREIKHGFVATSQQNHMEIGQSGFWVDTLLPVHFSPRWPHSAFVWYGSTPDHIHITSPQSYQDWGFTICVWKWPSIYHSPQIRISLLPVKGWTERGWKNIFPWGAGFRNTLLTNVLAEPSFSFFPLKDAGPTTLELLWGLTGIKP